MGYNITIDQGNSATKVALWCVGDMVATMRYDVLREDDVKHLAISYGLDVAMLSSVARMDTSVVNAINDLCSKVYILNHKTKLPIVNDYTSPETLGCDRIAAAVGAKAIFPDRTILVVDFGTAVTYDVVTEQGHYIGGNIAPGLKMRIDSLHHYTAKLPQVAMVGDCPLWGINTDTAIRAGVVNGIVGELTYYYSQLPENSVVLCTGGDAEFIARKVDFEIIVEPNLVDIGLNSILLYNENK